MLLRNIYICQCRSVKYSIAVTCKCMICVQRTYHANIVCAMMFMSLRTPLTVDLSTVIMSILTLRLRHCPLALCSRSSWLTISEITVVERIRTRMVLASKTKHNYIHICYAVYCNTTNKENTKVILHS